MQKLRIVVLWIFWIVVLIAVTVAGTRNNAGGLGTANPRSYEQRKLEGGSSNPCESSDVPSRSLRTSSGPRSRGGIE